jgi:hypothetical protein
MYSYDTAGCLSLDHSAADQCTNYGSPNGCTIQDLSDNCWEMGDLLCFITEGSSISHVGMCILKE